MTPSLSGSDKAEATMERMERLMDALTDACDEEPFGFVRAEAYAARSAGREGE